MISSLSDTGIEVSRIMQLPKVEHKHSTINVFRLLILLLHW